MAQKHTIETLTTDLNSFKKYVRGVFKEMQPQLTEMHDYMLDQKGFERGKAANPNNSGTINISKDAWGLILKLIVIIGAILGIKLLP